MIVHQCALLWLSSAVRYILVAAVRVSLPMYFPGQDSHSVAVVGYNNCQAEVVLPM